MATTFLHIDNWHINIETGEAVNNLSPDGEDMSNERVDPLGVKLLIILAQNQGELVTKESLLTALWPNTIVNEDALSQCVSRVRKLLGDQHRQPKFIETLPRRGYRLIATPIEWHESDDCSAPTLSETLDTIGTKKRRYLYGVSLLVLVLLSAHFIFFDKASTEPRTEVSRFVQQADIYYHKVTRQDNEMALELYQKAIALSPDLAIAHSGLANTIVQRSIRLPNPNKPTAWQDMNLGQALSDGRLFNEPAKQQLNKALKLSEKAVQLSPNDPRTHKALGFVLSAQNNMQGALNSYKTALSLNPNAWDVLINIGDIYEISGQLTNAISSYKKAFNSMTNKDSTEISQARQWRADLGAGIGDKYLQQNNLIEAEVWFRHVLSFAPFSPEATKGLANVLKLSGQVSESERLCLEYLERIGQAICD